VRIVRYGDEAGDRWGIVEDGVVLAASGEPFVDLRPTTEVGSLDEVRLLAPVRPHAVICVGRNYAAHAEEFGNEAPAAPILFHKPVSSIIGPGAPIEYPTLSARVDHEAELAVVVGAPAYRVDRARAAEVIGGYTCGNDVTARDLQKSDPGGQWTRGKGFATFCPLGPWIETDLDPSDLRVTATVDGERRQDGRTSAFIFDVPFLIEYVSAFMRLLPGDVLLTGTPEGVGPLAVGSEVTVEVEGIGQLTNPVIASAEGSHG
jgi:2-keto-4-pentenoate hydratase/2-oxohepta-3-ene-1,7-dioic acid hydratase in catechol pathway